ncbi:zinc-finger-containing protein [Undibacterium sp. JH2W]|uniref:zinc-finger-containing protein n=1 Tax=Undibacterium sp. JH2W TaxID=3413037 RepID=UPI003BF44C4B
MECPHCQSKVIKIAHHDEIYGKAFGEWPWDYLCTGCRAYVGMHPFTNIPLGTLADTSLRKARSECKQPFEVLYQSKKMTRDQAYAELAQHLGIPVSECHFGWFGIATCERARDWAIQQLRGKTV